MLSLALLGYLVNQVFVVSTNFFLSWHRGMREERGKYTCYWLIG